MNFFSFLPDFPLANVLPSFFDVVFNQNTLVTYSKSEKAQPCGPLFVYVQRCTYTNKTTLEMHDI